MSIAAATARGRVLRASGYTALRAFRVLKREYPVLEWDVLWAAVEDDLQGADWPLWAYHGSSPAEARFRNDPRKETV